MHLHFKTKTKYTSNVCSKVLNHAALETNSCTLQTHQQFTMRTTKGSNTGRYARSRSRAPFIVLQYGSVYVCKLSSPLWLQISLVKYHFVAISLYKRVFLFPLNKKVEDVELQPSCMKFSGLEYRSVPQYTRSSGNSFRNSCTCLFYNSIISRNSGSIPSRGFLSCS